MIHWKLSILSIALGAGATLGFVWLARSRSRLARAPLPLLDADDAAHADALRDIESEDVDFEFDVEEVETEVRSLDEETPTGDEQYDAVAPEDMGTEWLRRAIEAPPISPPEAEPLALTSGDTAEEIPVGNIDQADSAASGSVPGWDPGHTGRPNE